MQVLHNGRSGHWIFPLDVTFIFGMEFGPFSDSAIIENNFSSAVSNILLLSVIVSGQYISDTTRSEQMPEDGIGVGRN